MPTVCVTRAGAGGGMPSDWKRLRRRKKLGIAPDSPASGARFVSPRVLQTSFAFQGTKSSAVPFTAAPQFGGKCLITISITSSIVPSPIILFEEGAYTQYLPFSCDTTLGQSCVNG